MTHHEPQYYAVPPRPAKRSPWGLIAVIGLGAVLVGGAFYFLSNQPAVQQASLVETAPPDSQAQNNSEDGDADPDGDGLTNSEEERYGSNPTEADTDKDGFSDGDEVSNGYNPNGAGKLSADLPEPDQVSEPTQGPTTSGIALSEVFGGSGSYTCSITGGVSNPNTVTLKVKDGRVRQETPIEDTTLVMVIDGRDFYMSGFEGGNYIKLDFEVANGVASGEGATVSDGIFGSEALVLATKPTAVSCEEANWPNGEFVVDESLIINQ